MRIGATVWEDPRIMCAGAPRPALAVEGILQIECALRDERGETARDQKDIAVEVEDGELLGIENGDLDDNTRYTTPQRRTFDGRLIVFVRPGERTVVRLRAEGLPDVRVECGK